MLAPQTVSETAAKPQVIPSEVSLVMLHLLAESLEAAMNAPIIPVTRASRIGEFAGASYNGSADYGDLGTLHYYREPKTGTSLAVWERDLTVTALLASMKAAHIRFGVEVLS